MQTGNRYLGKAAGEVSKIVTNKLISVNNLLNKRYRRKEDIRDYVAALESQFVRLVSMKTTSDDSTKLAVVISIVNDCNIF